MLPDMVTTLVTTADADQAYNHHPILKKIISRTGMPLHNPSHPWCRKSLPPLPTHPQYHLNHPLHRPLSPLYFLAPNQPQGRCCCTLWPRPRYLCLRAETILVGSAVTLSGSTGLSIQASRRKYSRDDLVHLVSVASLTESPTIVKAVVEHLSLITQLRVAKRANIEALLLPDS